MTSEIPRPGEEPQPTDPDAFTLDNPRVVIAKDVDPKLRSVVSLASRVSANLFRAYRQDVAERIPPILLMERDDFYQLQGLGTKDQEYLRGQVTGTMMFEGGQGVVFAAKDDLLELLALGPKGFRYTSLMLGEQNIHALSTDDTEEGYRIGFIQIPGTTQRHKLEPGQLYDYHPTFQTIERSGRRGSFIPEPEHNLTDNVTRFLLHLALNRYVPMEGDKFPYIVVSTRDDHGFVEPKATELLQGAAQSLATGDRRVLNPLLYKVY